METAALVLEYLKVFLSAPVLFSAVTLIFFYKFSDDIKALLLRIAKIKLPGGTEFTTPQSYMLAEEKDKSAPVPEESPVTGLPQSLTDEQRQSVEQLVRSHIATSYLWEYRYLSYFLVRNTQVVLDWLVSLQQPITYAFYDSFWLPTIPSASERQAIIEALQMHHLISLDDAGITVSPKGREYQGWRGELPPLSSVPTEHS